MAFWLDPLNFGITFLWDAAMAVITPHFFFSTLLFTEQIGQLFLAFWMLQAAVTMCFLKASLFLQTFTNNTFFTRREIASTRM